MFVKYTNIHVNAQNKDKHLFNFLPRPHGLTQNHYLDQTNTGHIK